MKARDLIVRHEWPTNLKIEAERFLLSAFIDPPRFGMESDADFHGLLVRVACDIVTNCLPYQIPSNEMAIEVIANGRAEGEADE